MGALGYLAVRRGVKAANERLPEPAYRALAPAEGSILTTPTNILVLGADAGGTRADRQGTGRADSIMLIRTDPDEHRIAYLSLPRDLRVEIPGRGTDKINAAYAFGGAALAIDTVEALTGLPVNHVIVVDFGTFREVIDAVGGITIDNPKPVLSNRFDCPFRGAEACAEFKGWRFKQGEIELDGRRALIYARIRENQLDPSESDITRGERQQRVIQALTDEVVGVRGFFRLPFIGDDIVKPLAMDLSTNELLRALVGPFPRRRREDAPLPPRRHAGERRLAVPAAVRGQRARDRADHRPERAATPARRPTLRSRLLQRARRRLDHLARLGGLLRLLVGLPVRGRLLGRRARVALLAVAALGTPAVVGRVEPRALEVDRGRVRAPS